MRRSTIEPNAQDLATEDLITPTDMVVTLSHTGYIKSQPLNEYRAQKCGGRGKQATTTTYARFFSCYLKSARVYRIFQAARL